MSKIKICGLTRPCDIDFVNEAKPDFCGFIINVPNGRVITTMSQDEMKENIFTNIDGAVIL